MLINQMSLIGSFKMGKNQNVNEQTQKKRDAECFRAIKCAFSDKINL